MPKAAKARQEARCRGGFIFSMNTPHPFKNGTSVRINHKDHSGTGVVCDHEMKWISKTQTAIFYHVAMDWPNVVKGFWYDAVEPTGQTC